MRKFYFLTVLMFFAFSNTFGQDFKTCGQTEALNLLQQNHPNDYQEFIESRSILESQTEESNLAQFGDVSKGTVYTIPVVFHVLHYEGIGNISDAQIQDAINILNRDFRKLNSDISMVPTQFQAIAADVEIEFVLATIAPDGTCFEGITRTETVESISSHSSQGQNFVEAVIAGNDVYQGVWPHFKYMNVFVCRELDGFAGYAYYPWSNTQVSAQHLQYNSIYMLHDYVGSIGTSSEYKSRALTHEVGHWLNLLHVWGDGDIGTCGNDFVADTPQTEGTYPSSTGSCNLNQSTCDNTIDNVNNYMDYSYCSKMFTNGQATRMRTTLTGSVGGRNNLWQTSNLQDVGVIDGGSSLCANIEATEIEFCEGGSTTFTTISDDPIFSYSWSFPGGTPSSSTLENPTVTYNTPGIYSVTLEIENANGIQTRTFNDYITVMSASSPPDLTETSETCTQNNFFTVKANNYTGNDADYTISPTSATINGSVITGTIGNYTIVVTNYNGCVSEPTYFEIKDVLPTPSVPLLSEISETCTNNSSFEIIAASYTGNDSDYTITPATATINDGVITGTSGNYTITVTNSDGCSSNGAEFEIIEKLPNPNSPELIETTETCTENNFFTINEESYTGNDSDYIISPTTATINNGVITGTLGYYTISVVNSEGCVSEETSFEIKEMLPTPSVPNLTETPETCTDNSSFVVITTSYTGNDSDYTITPATATINDGVITGTSGNYTITVTNSDGCSSNETEFEIIEKLPNPSSPELIETPENCTDNSFFTIETTSYTGNDSDYIISPTTAAINNGVVTGVEGNYTITVTNSNGCISDATNFEIKDNLTTSLAPELIETPETCTENSYFTIQPNNYTGNDSDYTIIPATATINNGVITGIPGNYTISVVNSEGCISEETSFELKDKLPTPSAPVLIETPETCTDNSFYTIDTESYTGNDSDYLISPSSATITNGIISGVEGDYTINVTSSNGCISEETNFEIIGKLPVPDVSIIAENSAICYGDSVLLITSGADSYSWSHDLGSGNEKIVSPTSTTDYIVTGSIGECTNTASITVTVHPLPDTPSIVQDENQLIVNSESADWYYEGTYIGSGSTIDMVGDGNYEVIVSNSFDCISSTSGYFQGTSGLVDNEISYDLKLYPNPTTGKVTISSSLMIDEISIFDNIGKVVYTVKTFDKKEITLDLKGFAAGSYHVYIKMDDYHHINKIIIK